MKANRTIPMIVLFLVIAVATAVGLYLKDGEDAGLPRHPLSPHPGAHERPDLCPPDFAYFAGGTFTATRIGERWLGGIHRYEVDIKPFCLAKYEASAPGATAESRGLLHMAEKVPPAQVKAGVVPWSSGNWFHALAASHLQGWELPTYEELQYVATSGDPANRWIWGRRWDCKQAERSWCETCRGAREFHEEQDFGPAGGPTGQSHYHLPVFDLYGNLSEWTATPWDESCYGFTRFSLFGESYNGNHENQQVHRPDPDKPGCYKTEKGGPDNFSEQDHEIWMRLHHGGFRPKAAPGEQWKDWTPKTVYEEVTFPIEVSYFDETGAQRSFAYDPVNEMNELNRQAASYMNQGKWKEAQILIRKSLRVYPYTNETHQLWNQVIHLKNRSKGETPTSDE